MNRLLCLAILIASLAPCTVLARQPVYGSIYYGGSSFDVDYQFSEPLSFDPDDSGDSYGLGVGYEITDHWFIQLDYTYTDVGDVDIDQIFVSLNYQVPLFIKGMRGIAGVVVGEGRLEWNDQPDFADSIFDDLKNDESLYGIQLGLNYDLSEHWSTSLTYQYFDQQFNTNVETDAGRLSFEHSNYQYLLFGLRFHL